MIVYFNILKKINFILDKKLILLFLSSILFLLFFKGKFFSPNYLYVGDPLYYISHLSTILFDFDLDYTNEISITLNEKLIDINSNEYLENKIPPSPIGTSLIASIFSIPFALMDKMTDNDILDNRHSYQNSFLILGFLTSTIVSFFIGVISYLKTMSITTKSPNYLLSIILILGSGILYYVFNTPIYSHVYEFAILGLVLLFSVRLANNFTYTNMLILTLLLFLNLITRYNNFNILLLPLIVFLIEILKSNEFIYFNKKLIKLFFLIILSFIFSNFLTIHFYDAFIFEFSKIYSIDSVNKIYPDGHDLLNHLLAFFNNLKNLRILVFGFENGIIFSNPILLISFIIFPYIIYKISKERKNYFLAIFIVFLFISYYLFSLSIALNWKSTAGSYGYRYLLNLLPLSIYTIFLSLRYLRNKQYKLLKIFIILLSMNSFCSQLFTDTTPELSPKNQINSYGIERDMVYKNYNMNIYKELLSHKLYFTTFSKSVLGLASVQLLSDEYLLTYQNNELFITYKRYYPEKDIKILFKIIFLYIIWNFCIYFLYRFILLIKTKKNLI